MLHLRSLVGLLVSICLLSACQRNGEPEYHFRAALWANERHTWYLAMQSFAEEVYDKSDGRIEVEVYPSEQLAKEIEAIRLIQAEVIDMTITGSLLSNWIEIAAFCELPFLLQSDADRDALLQGPIGQRVEREMLERTGLRPLGYFIRGPRHLTSNRPIRHPDELNGMIIRVPNVPSFVTAWEAMGAKPTPMAFSEVFTGLQQGTIEGQENPFSLILNAGFPEVQQYVNLTEHVMSWSYPVIGERQFQALPADLQTIVLEAAQNMQAYEHELFTTNENSVKAELEKRGMTFVEVDKAAFQAKCERAIFESLSPEMQEVYQGFISERKAARQ
ncbi:TRAP transporter substrate-binding protein [Neolewinella agarilytica]|jgi:tripartite ATP-independent transporter DctP family solute receptor|uniref:Tripartite ATP-independent transporter solute receptor, DctP family n=1 Tax=Neolewinella agarilytica TaxID=478744 RepID=A0A1H9G744_9BACT|nr:TRAP transporter substrate-binding protein [Neolewinella agarilytica]SEQ45956.1 tripartite ATP-independent transporter solute receptor, DctP family [Neolewinella agarilytica]